MMGNPSSNFREPAYGVWVCPGEASLQPKGVTITEFKQAINVDAAHVTKINTVEYF